MPTTRPFMLTAILAIAAAAIAGSAAPAWAGPGASGDIFPAPAWTNTLKSNTEAEVDAFVCPSHHPYLLDRVDARGVPKGVAILGSPSIKVLITTRLATDTHGRVRGWTREGGRAIAFHVDESGQAPPATVVVMASCTDDPDLAYTAA